MSDTYTPTLKGIAYDYFECVKGHAFCTRHAFGYGEGTANDYDVYDESDRWGM